MNKLCIPMVVLAAVVCLTLTACPGIGYVAGTGPVINQTYDFTDFKNIEISSAFGFDISRADSYSLTITAHENLFSYMDIQKTGNTLIIRMKRGNYTNPKTRAAISLPELNSLTITGASQGSARGFMSKNSLQITASGASLLEIEIDAGRTSVEVSGASKLTGSLTAQDTRFNISGASRCDLTGSSVFGDIKVSGASQFTSQTFKMQDGAVNVSGASSAKLFTSGTLEIEASGASSVIFGGKPTIKGLNVSGASRVSSE